MADIDLYLDPVCPFSWVTSRWLLDAAHQTHTSVFLRQMSLAVLNEGKELEGKQRRMMERSRRLGRVFAAVAAKHGPDAFARLYDALGTRLHVQDDDMTAAELKEVLCACGFDESLADALDEALDHDGLDEDVRRSHQASQDALGGSAGSPIMVVDGRGFHGPVLTRIPRREDGVRLLDAVLTAAQTPEFATLQRPPQGPPTLEEAPR